MIETEDWVAPFKEANKLYDAGKYPDAFRFANEAIEFLRRDYSFALRKRMWSARQIGYKDEFKRSEMYEIARNDAYEVLEISKDVEVRNSAIKLLMLLPGEDIKDLCRAGITELENAQFFNESTKKDLLAELKNSFGIEIEKSDPEEAMRKFLEAYETVSKNTTLAGHLLHNAGRCWLKMANAEKNNLKKWSYLTYALDNLEKSLKEYPEDQTGHRKAVEGKIKDTKNKIKEANDKIKADEDMR